MKHDSTVSPDRLEAHVRVLSESCAPRDAAHPDRLDQAADYIHDAFSQASERVSRQPYQVGSTTYGNVIVRFGPDTQERLVVGAHYDAVENTPGADDNASGVAGLIELAHLVAGEELPIGVELVAYSLEEPPFFYTDQMGSAVHATSLKQQGIDVRAMLALEMIGFFSDAPDSQRFPLFLLKALYPSTGNFITVAGKIGQGRLVRRVKKAMDSATPLPARAFVGPSIVPGVSLSDHLNYWQAGYPAAMITDTAFYRNPYYHTPHDTADMLDYDRMAFVVEGVHAAVMVLCRQGV